MTKWIYTDAAGVERVGTVESTSDRGGNDVTYFFRRDSGELDVLQGTYMARTGAHPAPYENHVV